MKKHSAPFRLMQFLHASPRIDIGPSLAVVLLKGLVE
jgi:hypothetical protein